MECILSKCFGTVRAETNWPEFILQLVSDITNAGRII